MPTSGETQPVGPPADIRFVPIEQIATAYVALRPGALRPRTDPPLAEPPLRVALSDSGRFELIDGFKRLERWRDEGHTQVPVLVDRPGSAVEHKRLLLAANAPPRTVTPLDEARVVRSLIEDDGLSHREAARVLGKRPEWIAARDAIATRCSTRAKEQLGAGAIGPTLALALTALSPRHQDALLATVDEHSLSAREAVALVHAFRVADETDRRDLLRNPLGAVGPDAGSAALRSPTEIELGQRRRPHPVRPFPPPFHHGPRPTNEPMGPPTMKQGSSAWCPHLASLVGYPPPAQR